MKALIGVDFGESSISAVGWVSRWFLPRGPLALAYGVWMPEGPALAASVDTEREFVLERAKQEGRQALAPLVMEHGPNRTEALVAAGTPADVLLELADEWGADLIAVGPHGHSSILTGFFGSTAASLLRQSTVPILVVRHAEAGIPERILVAIDESGSASRVLEAAREVVAAHGCEVTGFYAVQAMSNAATPEDQESAFVDPAVHTAASSWLQKELADSGISKGSVQATLGAGCAGPAICSAAAHDVHLIVMGTRGAGVGSPLDSVARYVVAHAPCPVLVIPTRAD